MQGTGPPLQGMVPICPAVHNDAAVQRILQQHASNKPGYDIIEVHTLGLEVRIVSEMQPVRVVYNNCLSIVNAFLNYDTGVAGEAKLKSWTNFHFAPNGLAPMRPDAFIVVVYTDGYQETYCICKLIDTPRPFIDTAPDLTPRAFLRLPTVKIRAPIIPPVLIHTLGSSAYVNPEILTTKGRWHPRQWAFKMELYDGPDFQFTPDGQRDRDAEASDETKGTDEEQPTDNSKRIRVLPRVLHSMSQVPEIRVPPHVASQHARSMRYWIEQFNTQQSKIVLLECAVTAKSPLLIDWRGQVEVQAVDESLDITFHRNRISQHRVDQQVATIALRQDVDNLPDVHTGPNPDVYGIAVFRVLGVRFDAVIMLKVHPCLERGPYHKLGNVMIVDAPEHPHLVTTVTTWVGETLEESVRQLHYSYSPVNSPCSHNPLLLESYVRALTQKLDRRANQFTVKQATLMSFFQFMKPYPFKNKHEPPADFAHMEFGFVRKILRGIDAVRNRVNDAYDDTPSTSEIEVWRAPQANAYQTPLDQYAYECIWPMPPTEPKKMIQQLHEVLTQLNDRGNVNIRKGVERTKKQQTVLLFSDRFSLDHTVALRDVMSLVKWCTNKQVLHLCQQTFQHEHTQQAIYGTCVNSLVEFQIFTHALYLVCGSKLGYFFHRLPRWLRQSKEFIRRALHTVEPHIAPHMYRVLQSIQAYAYLARAGETIDQTSENSNDSGATPEYDTPNPFIELWKAVVPYHASQQELNIMKQYQDIVWYSMGFMMSGQIETFASSFQFVMPTIPIPAIPLPRPYRMPDGVAGKMLQAYQQRTSLLKPV